MRSNLLRFLPLVVLAVGAIGVGALLLTSERDVYSSEILNVGLSSNLDTLDPNYTETNNVAGIVLNVYENLLMYDYGRLDRFVPLLSTAVPSTQNGLITERPDGKYDVAFPIREGVLFHNGEMLTPDDVAYSFRRLFVDLNPLSDGDQLFRAIFGVSNLTELAEDDLGMCQAIFDAIRVDGDRVIFTIVSDPEIFFSRIALGNRVSAIVSRDYLVERGAWPGDCESWRDYSLLDLADQPLNETMMGTGPFKFTRWDRGAEVVLERFDDYWRGPAKLRAVRFMIVNESATQRIMFEKGDLDVIYVARSLTGEMEGVPGIRSISKLPTISSFDLLFNYNINPRSEFIGSGALDGEGIPPDFFTDIDVRKAFNDAFDWNLMIDEVFENEARQSRGPIPRVSHHFDPETPIYNFDLEKAEEHFRAAWNGDLWERGFHLTFAINSESAERRQVAQMMKANIESLNEKFKIDIETRVFQAYLNDMYEGFLPVFFMSWQGNVPYPDEFIDPYYLSTGTMAPHMSSAEIFDWDELLIAAANGKDSLERDRRYSELQQLAYDNAAGIFMFDLEQRRWQRSWVGGWYYNPALPGYAGYLYEAYKSEDGTAAEIHPRVRRDFPDAVVETW